MFSDLGRKLSVLMDWVSEGVWPSSQGIVFMIERTRFQFLNQKVYWALWQNSTFYVASVRSAVNE